MRMARLDSGHKEPLAMVFRPSGADVGPPGPAAGARRPLGGSRPPGKPPPQANFAFGFSALCPWRVFGAVPIRIPCPPASRAGLAVSAARAGLRLCHPCQFIHIHPPLRTPPRNLALKCKIIFLGGVGAPGGAGLGQSDARTDRGCKRGFPLFFRVWPGGGGRPGAAGRTPHPGPLPASGARESAAGGAGRFAPLPSMPIHSCSPLTRVPQ